MFNRKTIPGHFTRLAGSSQIGIGEEEARRLLQGSVRDVDESIASLKANPFGPFAIGEGGTVRYEVHKGPVVTVPDGGPALRGPFDDARRQAQFMLDLIADLDPISYDRLFERVEEKWEDAQEAMLALLMEQLDSLRTDLLFGVQHAHPEDEHLTLGFWPIELGDKPVEE